MKKAKYLFFDIECSNGYNICSFGYCLVSEKLKVVEKRDIIINPESKFILAKKGNRPKIELSYPKEYFYKQDNFKAFYETIKNLLVDSGYILLGHSVQSDIYFLKYACERYGLPKLEIKAFDTQLIFKRAFERDHVESLEGILEQLDFETDRIAFHKSCDDALATFYVAREICWQIGMTMEELLLEYNDCIFSSECIEERAKIVKKKKA